eukprot:CAMPEP_0114256906 /NCGR_PEP_ID=MMETSP0058-20121206/18430_1 /TAXON_ID=36894 /ORGANISM="Pyramimonas parkeae, CCMP726" /LENGTH=311 /DNA_ID=CAMNT_0001371559 /DNA_START=173 /DNA_END=1108 /DNA_ORIENTATION=-
MSSMRTVNIRNNKEHPNSLLLENTLNLEEAFDEGPVMIFGGPYSNLEATQAVLNEAKRCRIPPHRIICTGDVVAYCADPQATVDLVRHAGIHVVQGNCERSLGMDSEDCGCGFETGSACSRLSVQWYDYARRSLDEGARAWMRELPTCIRFQMGGVVCCAVHATPASESEFVFASTPSQVKRRRMAVLGDARAVACGHSGIPFSQEVQGRLWHNAGVIGMPANDGTPRVWYSIWEAAEHGLRIRHLPLEYDYTSAAGKMGERGLPDGYREALTSGLWPSLDVLPPLEKQAAGNRIDQDALDLTITFPRLGD